MSEQRTSAELVHALKGRARMRVKDRAGDEPFFRELAGELAKEGAVSEVRTSARTASVLILFTGELAPLLERVRALGIRLDVAAARPHTPMHEVHLRLERADAQLSERTRGAVSMGALAFFALLGATAYQARKGNFLPAGMTLLKYALEAMEHAAEREVSSPR